MFLTIWRSHEKLWLRCPESMYACKKHPNDSNARMHDFWQGTSSYDEECASIGIARHFTFNTFALYTFVDAFCRPYRIKNYIYVYMYMYLHLYTHYTLLHIPSEGSSVTASAVEWVECVAGSLEEGQGCLHACRCPRRVTFKSKPLGKTAMSRVSYSGTLPLIYSPGKWRKCKTCRCHEVHYTACTQTKPWPWIKDFSGLGPSWIILNHLKPSCVLHPSTAYCCIKHALLPWIPFLWDDADLLIKSDQLQVASKLLALYSRHPVRAIEDRDEVSMLSASQELAEPCHAMMCHGVPWCFDGVDVYRRRPSTSQVERTKPTTSGEKFVPNLRSLMKTYETIAPTKLLRIWSVKIRRNMKSESGWTSASTAFASPAARISLLSKLNSRQRKFVMVWILGVQCDWTGWNQPLAPSSIVGTSWKSIL